MSIPNLPAFFDMYYVAKDGRLTPDGYLYNDQMFQTLNELVNMFNNGIQFPQKTTAEITAYRDDNNVPVGTTWYNKSINKLQVKTALGSPGTIETITST